jgi:DNA repair protein RecO (recombination protein O)
MPRATVEGVILSLEERGEANILVTLLTPTEGPLKGVARQAKWSVRRFGGRLGLMNRISADYSRREPSALAFLEETELIERFPNIPKDPVMFGRCMTFAEVMAGAWGEGEPAEALYSFFVEYLRCANRMQMDEDRHYLEAFRLLALLGHRPALDRCASCGNPLSKGWRYSVIEGGTICGDCVLKLENRAPENPAPMRVRAETIRTIEAGFSLKPDRLGRLKFTVQGRKEAKTLWNTHIRILLGRIPKSAEFLDKIESSK